MEIREKLIALRENAQLSQMELADRVGVSRQTISRWESGTAVPATDNLKVLAEFYDISVDWLCSDSSTWPLPEAESSTTTQSVPSKAAGQIVSKSRVTAKKWAVILICAFLIAVAIFFCIAKSRNTGEGTPISALPSEDVTGDPESSFDFEW